MIDIEKAKKTFEKYVDNYDNNDPDIIRKRYHSLRVCDLIDDIVRNSNILFPNALELSQLIGLLHDIGRFEQDKQFNSHEDSKAKFDHAGYAIEILFDQNKLRDYIKETKYDNIIKQAIYNHNKLTLPDFLTEDEKLFSNILRDADKVDIMKIWADEKKEIPVNEIVSDSIIKNIKKKELVPNNSVTNHSEELLKVVSFIFDINYKYTYYIIEQSKYIEKLIEQIKDPRIKELLPELKEYLRKKVGELYVPA